VQEPGDRAQEPLLSLERCDAPTRHVELNRPEQQFRRDGSNRRRCVLGVPRGRLARGKRWKPADNERLWVPWLNGLRALTVLDFGSQSVQ
jgi:hypothetical protein